MNKPIRFILLAAVIAMCLGAPSAASAQSPWPPFCQEGSLPSHDPQYPADQLILTCIPPDWNGQLVLYAHGYVAAQMPLACRSTSCSCRMAPSCLGSCCRRGLPSPPPAITRTVTPSSRPAGI